MALENYKVGKVKFCILLLFTTAVAIFLYVLLDSLLAALFIFAALIFLLVVEVFRSRNRFRKVADKFYSNLSTYPNTPSILDKESGWLIDRAYCNSLRHSVAVKADEQGVLCHFHCYVRKKPVIIAWQRVKVIELGNFYYMQRKVLMARILLDFNPGYIFLPWRTDFSSFIPDIVDLKKVESWRALDD